MPARRLPAASTNEVERARVPFTFDGRRYEGVWGEPIAVSLLAVGRRTLSRSFRFHRPRGLMCSTGQCGWCECEVDGQPSVRTCRVPLREGMVLRGEHAWPSVEHDLLRGLDVGSRFVPPGFYHHRFLRPRGLRKAYLDVIRSFGGRGRLGGGGPSPAERSRKARLDDPDVLVVGGGRGGLLAAIAAAGAGARVVVLEEEAMVDAADGLLAEARGNGVEVRAGAAATGWYAGMVMAMDRDTTMELRPRAVVAATGSYELVPAIPGSDKPGVMGARLVLRLLARHGVLPGERAILVGAGEELDAAGAALEAAGATAVGPVPTAALRSIGGPGPVAWARYIEAGDDGTTRRKRLDLVVFGDRTPNLDLVLAAGGRVGWHDGRLAPELDLNGMTSLRGLFVAGDAAGVPADSTTAETQARIAGAAAGRFARAATTVATSAPALPAMTRTGDPPRSTSIGRPPAAASARAVLCFCEDVRAWEVRDELVAGYADPELVKRRTGALTGPCQGKYCLSAITCAIGAGGRDAAQASGATDTHDDLHLPTGRPPLRPLRLRDLIADDAPGPSAADRPASDAANHR